MNPVFKKQHLKISVLIPAVVLFFVACNNNVVYQNNHDFTNETWHKDSLAVFNVNITDTLAIYNFYINCRTTGQYMYSNMFLFIHAQMPNGQIINDTLECILASPDGKWLGKGFGSVWANKIPYKKNIRFQHPGNYMFTLEQAMRSDELPFVLDAGITIERAK